MSAAIAETETVEEEAATRPTPAAIETKLAGAFEMIEEALSEGMAEREAWEQAGEKRHAPGSKPPMPLTWMSAARDVTRTLTRWCIRMAGAGVVTRPTALTRRTAIASMTRDLDRVSAHPWGLYAAADIARAAHALHALAFPEFPPKPLDTPCNVTVAGPAGSVRPCGGRIMIRHGDALATCDRCGTSDYASGWTERLMRDELLLTIPDAHKWLAAHHGLVPTERTLRNWHTRGWLPDSGGTPGKPLVAKVHAVECLQRWRAGALT